MPYYQSQEVTVIPWRPAQALDRLSVVPRFTRLIDLQDTWYRDSVPVPKKPDTRGAERMLTLAALLLIVSLVAIGVSVVFLVLGSSETPISKYYSILQHNSFL